MISAYVPACTLKYTCTQCMYETQTPICVKRFIFTQGSEQSTGQTSGRQPSEEANTEYSGIIN